MNAQRGMIMLARSRVVSKRLAFALALVGAAQPAAAATVIIYTDPMTLERKTVVYDTPGPHRAFMCMTPPAESDCVPVRIRSSR